MKTTSESTGHRHLRHTVLGYCFFPSTYYLTSRFRIDVLWIVDIQNAIITFTKLILQNERHYITKWPYISMLSVYGTRKPMHQFSTTALTVAGVLELVLFCRDNLQGRVTPWITTITFRFTPTDNLMRMSETVGRAVRTCELHSGSRREWNLQPCCCEATAITTAPLCQSTNSSGGKNMTVWLRCFEAQHTSPSQVQSCRNNSNLVVRVVNQFKKNKKIKKPC